MVESHFSILICLLLHREFQNLVNVFDRSTNLVAGLEGYPVFLPPRSMAQAEFLEVLDRLADGWRYSKFTEALVGLHRGYQRWALDARYHHFSSQHPPSKTPF